MDGSRDESGIWEKIPGRALRECTLGVVGVGNVGKAVIRRARAFGMRLLGNDIIEIAPDFVRENELEMLPLGRPAGAVRFRQPELRPEPDQLSPDERRHACRRCSPRRC